MVNPGSASMRKSGGATSSLAGTGGRDTRRYGEFYVHSTGGVTVQQAHSSDPQHELEVLKAILCEKATLSGCSGWAPQQEALGYAASV